MPRATQNVPYTPYREKRRNTLQIDKNKPTYENVVRLPDGSQIVRPTSANLETQMVNIAARNEIIAAFRAKHIQLEKDKIEAHISTLPDTLQKEEAKAHLRDLQLEQTQLANDQLVSQRMMRPTYFSHQLKRGKVDASAFPPGQRTLDGGYITVPPAAASQSSGLLGATPKNGRSQQKPSNLPRPPRRD